MSLSDLTQAPLRYNTGASFVEIHPLTISDCGQLCRVAQFSTYETAKAAGVDPETIREVLQKCLAHPLTMRSAELYQWAETVDGKIEIAFLSMRKTMSREAVGQLSPKQLTEIADLSLAISMETEDEGKKKALVEAIETLRQRGRLM